MNFHSGSKVVSKERGEKKKGKKKNVHCSRTIVFKSVYKGGNGISLLPEIGFV